VAACAASESAKLLTTLPNAAELYRGQIALGLDGAHPQIALKARLALRELLGQIRSQGQMATCGQPMRCSPRCWCGVPVAFVTTEHNRAAQTPTNPPQAPDYFSVEEW
jgi:hypothetical protein